MNKPIEPHKATFSVNGEILYSTTHIVYNLGKLSVTDSHIYNENDALANAKALYKLLGIEATRSQINGVLYGESVDDKPMILSLYNLYMDLLHMDPYDEKSLKKVEEAFFPYGVPNRLSRKIEGYEFPLPMHKKIDALVSGLFRFSKSNIKSMNPITIGCAFCYVFQAIGPYSSNTLPIALFYFHSFLASYSKSLAALNIFKIYNGHKEEVDAAYAESAEKGDMGPYLLCWMKLIDQASSSLLRQSIKGEGKVTWLVQKLLDAMKPGKEYSTLELCELLGLKSRVGCQRNYIRPALEAKVIYMKNPLVPTERNQRYIKKGA